MKKALIFGVTGQDGSYLAKLLLEKKYMVFGTSRTFSPKKLTNLKILGIDSKIQKMIENSKKSAKHLRKSEKIIENPKKSFENPRKFEKSSKIRRNPSKF